MVVIKTFVLIIIVQLYIIVC